jgi:hypothetical protein
MNCIKLEIDKLKTTHSANIREYSHKLLYIKDYVMKQHTRIQNEWLTSRCWLDDYQFLTQISYR